MGEPTAVPTDDIATAGSRPRAMIHKKILDIAQSNPDASLAEIAENASGASEKFVERVLDEYGDPARNDSRAKLADGFGGGGQQNVGSTQPESATDTPSASTPEESPAEADAETGTDGSDESETGGSETAAAETEASSPGGSATGADSDPPAEAPGSEDGAETLVTDPSELTAKQRETLRVVHRDPTATQEEIATTLDVTRATISKRVNEIPGFDWANRRAFVDRLFDGNRPAEVEYPRIGPTSDASVDELASRVSALEDRLDEEGELDTELTHKVVHACMDAEYLSEDEELELLRTLL